MNGHIKTIAPNISNSEIMSDLNKPNDVSMDQTSKAITLYTLLVASTGVLQEGVDEHATLINDAVNTFLEGGERDLPRKHHVRLLRGVLVAQDRGMYFPLLDTALAMHGWRQLLSVLRRFTLLTEGRIIEGSKSSIHDTWKDTISTFKSLTAFIVRCFTAGCWYEKSKVVCEMVINAGRLYPKRAFSCDWQDFGCDRFMRLMSMMYTSLKDADSHSPRIHSSFHEIITKYDASVVYTIPSTAPGNRRISFQDIIVTSGEDADITLHVHREALRCSSLLEVMERHTHVDWEKCETVDVRFVGEPGYGEGVVRDWIGELCRDIFFTSGLFVTCPEDGTVIHPNPELLDDDATCMWMEFTGFILGLAKRLHIETGIHFSRSAVSMITLQHVNVLDLAQLDPVLSRSCDAVRNMDDAVVDLGSFVSPGLDCVLFPGGEDVQVAPRDRKLFADMLARTHIRGKDNICAHSCHHIGRGICTVMSYEDGDEVFQSLCSQDAIAFNGFFGGEGIGQDIDVREWESSTISHPSKYFVDVDRSNLLENTVRMLFESLHTLTPHDKRCLLRFWTGSSCLPFGGFKALGTPLRLIIKNRDILVKRLPNAHTCARTLVIYTYASVQDFKECIELCIKSMHFDDTQ